MAPSACETRVGPGVEHADGSPLPGEWPCWLARKLLVVIFSLDWLPALHHNVKHTPFPEICRGVALKTVTSLNKEARLLKLQF